ncbi:MAG TPA: cytochrome C oxidase subunit IV family protein [Gemmatimonadales bacterium]|nr:cytochrome C oxidase subunit IV family protein [Gemmatimonadales bacterium]
MSATAHAHDAGHAHPTWQLYTKIAFTLFVLTFLEVAGYEVVHRGEPAGLASMLGPILTEVLLILSAFKFALVAMFYMHLKSDGKLLSSIFSFSLILAAVIVVGLLLIFTYLYSHSPTLNPAK